jgi:hypothetical protein
MPRSTFRLLLRFRWPLLLALVTLSVLYLVMQPQPMATYRIKMKTQLSSHRGDSVKLSPSGKYLVAHDLQTAHLHLYDVERASLLFSVPCIQECCDFDADDGLAFASISWPQEGIEHIDLMHWKPGEATPRVVESRISYPKDIANFSRHASDLFNGVRNNTGKEVNAILFPDALTWFVPKLEISLLRFDVVDARNGSLRCHLNMPAFEITEKSPYQSMNVVISPCGKWVLLQLKSEEEKSIRLQIYCATTGEKQPLDKLYQKEEPWTILTFKREEVFAVSDFDGVMYLHELSNKGYRRTLLKETVPPYIETSVGQANKLLSHSELKAKHGEVGQDGLWTYTWLHEQSLGFGSGMGLNATLEGRHFAVRDLRNGSLINSGVLLPAKTGGYDRWHFLRFITKSDLLYLEPSHELSAWQITLDQWRERYTNWQPLFPHATRMVLVDAATGRKSMGLRYGGSSEFMATLFCEAEHTLSIVMEENGELVIRKYAYPLRMPWLMMLFWSGGLFGGLVFLQMALGWLGQRWRRRK